VRFGVYYPVDGQYLEALGLRLLTGRFLTDHDDAHAKLVVVIDEHMARTAFAGRDPLGQHIRLEENRPLEVVGVVAHVNNYGLGEPEAAEDQFYLSWRQISPAWYVPTNSGFDITVRAKPGVEPTSLASAVAGAVESLDPEQPVHTVQTMQKLVDDSVSGRRFAMLLFGAFAAIALTLALTGLYSVMSYIVAQRTHEMGVRMALGAQPRQVQTMVVTQGLRLVGLGLGCGIVASLALGSFMSSILYGVRATDPLTFVSVSFVLAATAFFASWLPARRASRVDPIVALRSE
jgi:predicted permease